MQITVVERESYNGEKALHIFTEEKVESWRMTYKKRSPIFHHYFRTGWNIPEKERKIAEKRHEKCVHVLFNKRVAKECLDHYDETVKECAEIRMRYPKVYFKREKN